MEKSSKTDQQHLVIFSAISQKDRLMIFTSTYMASPLILSYFLYFKVRLKSL